MGDIGNAAAGGMNMLGTIYAAERNYDAQMATNSSNEYIHQQDNQFNASEAAKTRAYNTGERLSSQDFNAQQADLNRQFQSAEADKARQFQLDSIGKSAAEYQKLGINPSGTVQGIPSGSSFPSGSAASSSPASASPASASPFAGFSAPHFENPIASFIEAFQGAQRTQDQHTMNKLMAEEQEIKNDFQVRRELLSLRQQNADIQEKLSNSDLNRATRDKLKSDKRVNDLNIRYLEDTLTDRTQLAHEENMKAANENQILCEQYVQEQIQTKWMPKLLSSQYNLNNAQAQAALTAANAAMKQAFVAVYDAKTRRMQYRFDETKFETVLRDNYNAQTKMMLAQTGAADASADESAANSDYLKQKGMLEEERMKTDLFNTLINSVSSELKSAVHMIGGTLIFNNPKPKQRKAEYGDYINPYSTTSTEFTY